MRRIVIKREGHKIIIEPRAAERIAADLCPACAKPKSEWTRRTTWRCCSPYCTSDFQRMQIWYNWSQYRERVFERDAFRCAKCAFVGSRDGAGNYSSLVADHIVPIALGGAEWDMDNIQTLCVDCNKIKTAADARKIASARRAEKAAYKLDITRQAHRPFHEASPSESSP